MSGGLVVDAKLYAVVLIDFICANLDVVLFAEGLKCFGGGEGFDLCKVFRAVMPEVDGCGSLCNLLTGHHCFGELGAVGAVISADDIRFSVAVLLDDLLKVFFEVCDGGAIHFLDLLSY